MEWRAPITFINLKLRWLSLKLWRIDGVTCAIEHLVYFHRDQVIYRFFTHRIFYIKKWLPILHQRIHRNTTNWKINTHLKTG
jgi:hypothetical protein